MLVVRHAGGDEVLEEVVGPVDRARAVADDLLHHTVRRWVAHQAVRVEVSVVPLPPGGDEGGVRHGTDTTRPPGHVRG